MNNDANILDWLQCFAMRDQYSKLNHLFITSDPNPPFLSFYADQIKTVSLDNKVEGANSIIFLFILLY